MVLAEHLEAADNETHAEQRVARLNGLDTSIEDSKFFIQGNGFAIVVENAAHDMAVFHHSNKLVHEVTSRTVQNPFEERRIVVELEGQLELELETTPNSVVSALFG